MKQQTFWSGPVAEMDDFGDYITGVFYDAPTRQGPWAIMSYDSWLQYRTSPNLGTGLGQKYRKQDDGRWLKVEG